MARKEFISLNSRRCTEGLLVFVTQCATHAMCEIKYSRFVVVFIATVSLCGGSQSQIVLNTEREL